jgi:hypothetical protein
MTILLFTCISLKIAEQNTAKSENLRFASKIVNLFRGEANRRAFSYARLIHFQPNLSGQQNLSKK